MPEVIHEVDPADPDLGFKIKVAVIRRKAFVSAQLTEERIEIESQVMCKTLGNIQLIADAADHRCLEMFAVKVSVKIEHPCSETDGWLEYKLLLPGLSSAG